MSEFCYRPLSDWVIVLPDEPEEISPGGVIVPQQAQERPREGTVMAAGPGRQLENGDRGAMQVQAGNRVGFGVYSGQPFEIGDNEYLVMREDDIIWIKKEEAK